MGGPLLGDPSPEQFCATLFALSQQASQQNAAADRSAVSAALITGWAHVAEMAPPELKGDAQVMAEAARQLTTGTLNSEDALRKISPAIQRLVRYTAEHCTQAGTVRPGG